MKYTKSIAAFMFLNLFIAFSMVFVANKTREIEKKNNHIKYQILKIQDDLKINLIELTAHKNSDYLKKMYSLYFLNNNNEREPNLFTLKHFQNNKDFYKLVNSKK